MRKINIAVMGCASIAQRLMLPAIKIMEEWNLVAVASRCPEKALNFAKEFECEAVVGYEKILDRDDVDAIYMPLPTGLHQEWIIKCLNAGKHVLAEKSIAYDYSSALSMVNLARKNGLVLMENYMFQYHSQHEFVKNQLINREIGDIRVFRASFAFPNLDKANFRYNEAIGGGALLDCAGYTVKAVHFILGGDFFVKASELFVDKEVETNIYGGALMVNGKGVIAQIVFGMDHFYQGNYEIWGNLGKIFVERAFTPKPTYAPRVIIDKQNKHFEYTLHPDNHFIGSLSEYHNSIVNLTCENHYCSILLQSKTLDDIRKFALLKF